MTDDDAHDATGVARWPLEAAVEGIALTKTHALARVVVREAAQRWPHWLNHDLFGAPHREAELPALAAVHEVRSA